MNKQITQFALVAGLFALSSGSTSSSDMRLYGADIPDEPGRVVVTAGDVQATMQEAAAAHSSLVAMWTDEFERIGEHFVAPKIARYRGNTRSACGRLPASNAVYCGRNNTIYFDDLFLTAQAKLTGAALHTDGDMAAVGIIAHEMGHAVTAQLGSRLRNTYAMEAAADCLAGAFAQRAEKEGSLEAGDLDEAFYAMAAAADPEFEPTGNRRIEARREAIMANQGHGTRAQRQGNFRSGYEGGGGACVPELKA